MKQIFKIKTDIVIVGDEQDFVKTTDVMGLSPKKTRKKEECRIAQFACDSWRYSTGYCELFDTADLLIKIMHNLDGKEKSIADYLKENSLEMQFSIYVHSSTDILPALTIPSEFIAFAAKFPAKIDFDIYANLGEQV